MAKTQIYLTEQSIKELLEGKSVFNDPDEESETELIPPKTNELKMKHETKITILEILNIVKGYPQILEQIDISDQYYQEIINEVKEI